MRDLEGAALLPAWLTGVQIETAAVPRDLEGAAARGVLWQAAPGRFLLEVPAVARYLVAAGHAIAIDVAPGVDFAEVRRFLRMTPLAALLFQRGMPALHAAAVATPAGAVVIAGDSGAGKSALAAALLQRGWQLLADEVVALDADDHGQPVVLPTFPELALWPDVLEHVGLRPRSGPATAVGSTDESPPDRPLEALGPQTISAEEAAAQPTVGDACDVCDPSRRSGPGSAGETPASSGAAGPIAGNQSLGTSGGRDARAPRADRDPQTQPTAVGVLCHATAVGASDRGRRLLAPCAHCFAREPRPLCAIYWLSVSHERGVAQRDLRGADRFRALLTLAYNTHIADALFDHALYYRRVAALTQAVPIRRLLRPRGQWSLEELARMIEP